MSRQTSEGAGKRYGLKRVCRVLEFPRSTLYAQQARESATVIPVCPQRRGPKPKVADTDLLAAIRAADTHEKIAAYMGQTQGRVGSSFFGTGISKPQPSFAQ